MGGQWSCSPCGFRDNYSLFGWIVIDGLMFLGRGFYACSCRPRRLRVVRLAGWSHFFLLSKGGQWSCSPCGFRDNYSLFGWIVIDGLMFLGRGFYACSCRPRRSRGARLAGWSPKFYSSIKYAYSSILFAYLPIYLYLCYIERYMFHLLKFTSYGS